ncbi:DUF4276 family protein [Polyangium sorediatum]|uniref:DUF4276 family protein n=2 Tax=Polyangium sorediatum TaxID=889274 RepID=A0ABT6P1M1_9BACT|nr:DUF4276 family protein [Polyangium sorediatum]MDI1434501.1 DUF4276 family protein [Polyangium sorediatum]
MTRRRVYLCAALYAEGPSDYDFLSPLINRLLDTLGNELEPGRVEVGETLGIDAPRPYPPKRVDRIAAAVAEYWDSFTLLVIHADGGGDPDEARKTCVAPGIGLASSAFPLVAVPCVPVREIEAWMLADVEVFRTILGRGAEPSLPAAPEREVDPKQSLRHILQQGGFRRGAESVHRLFGEEVRFEALRKLSAFQRFEDDLREAIRAIARASDGGD